LAFKRAAASRIASANALQTILKLLVSSAMPRLVRNS
jgi:hypothetical protein